MIKPVTYYTIVCDECGADCFEDDDYSAWSDEDGAAAVFADSVEGTAWVGRDGKHFCPDHAPRDEEVLG